MSALALPILGEGLENHFQACLDRGRPIVREKDTSQLGLLGFELGVVQKLFRQTNGRLMGQAKEGGVGDLVKLLADGLVNLWVGMAMQVGPNGGVAVEVLSAIAGGEPRPFARGDGDRVRGRVQPK